MCTQHCLILCQIIFVFVFFFLFCLHLCFLFLTLYFFLFVSLFQFILTIFSGVFHAFSLKAAQYNHALNNRFTSKFVVTVERDTFLVLHHNDAQTNLKKKGNQSNSNVKSDTISGPLLLVFGCPMRQHVSLVFLSVCMGFLNLQCTELPHLLSHSVRIFSRP